MQNLLGQAAQRELRRFLETDPLLAFDYDGTLCPIVEHAYQAGMRLRTRSLVQGLCTRSICVLLTGRSRADALKQTEGLALSQVVGNHGADWSHPRIGDDQLRARVARWASRLNAKLKGYEGVEIEDKGLSISVHYRHAAARLRALGAIRGEISKLTRLRVIGGKDVINLLPIEAKGKGQALRELMARFGKDTAVFVGDDATDEEVFALPARDAVFKIRVGHSSVSQATHYVPKQSDVDSLLEQLA